MKELPADTRMVQCVLRDYTSCPAKTPEACICFRYPYELYLKKLKKKYGDQES